MPKKAFLRWVRIDTTQYNELCERVNELGIAEHIIQIETSKNGWFIVFYRSYN